MDEYILHEEYYKFIRGEDGEEPLAVHGSRPRTDLGSYTMAVDGYYVVAGIARHEYKQGWKFLTLWDGYGLSEATWEPMSAFIQPDGSINPIFRTYLVENNEGQLLTRAETMLWFVSWELDCASLFLENPKIRQTSSAQDL